MGKDSQEKAKRPHWKLQRPLGGLDQRMSGQDICWLQRHIQEHPCLQSHVTVTCQEGRTSVVAPNDTEAPER